MACNTNNEWIWRRTGVRGMGWDWPSWHPKHIQKHNRENEPDNARDTPSEHQRQSLCRSIMIILHHHFLLLYLLWYIISITSTLHTTFFTLDLVTLSKLFNSHVFTFLRSFDFFLSHSLTLSLSYHNMMLWATMCTGWKKNLWKMMKISLSLSLNESSSLQVFNTVSYLFDIFWV